MLEIRVIDSITQLGPDDEGCIAVSGSHGGISAARYAMAARPLLSVFNDAGVGLHRAGIAGLDLLEQAGLAACAVSHESACIGDAQSTLENGTISHLNDSARELGLNVGQSLRGAVVFLQTS
jgi:uncharacterized protein YunC (DUF1805 family)